MGPLLYGVDWLFVLACIMLITWTVVWFFWFSAIIYGKIHLHRPVTNTDIEKTCLPGVSIAKPVCGAADPNLIANLTSYFELDYPQFELMFCVQDDTDTELIKIINELILKHPLVDAKLYIGAQDVGINPKVNNMMNAYDNAQHPYFMISDANILINEMALRDMVNHMTEKVGLVHQLPLYCDGALSFSRQVEKAWFGGAHARIYMAANAYGINCMTSMSCMFRKKILDEEGGLSRLGCYIGEDFFLAQMIINKGWRIALSSIPAQQNAGTSTIQSFQGRMKRWMYIRFTEMPHLLLLEPLQEHIFMGPLSGLAFYYLFSVPLYISIPAHFVAWMLADYILLQVLENKRCPFSLFAYIRAWVFRELSPLYLYPTVLRTRYIMWGGKRYIIHYGGKAERADAHNDSQYL